MPPEVRRHLRPTETPKAVREQLSGVLRPVRERPWEVLRPVRERPREVLRLVRERPREVLRPVRKQLPEALKIRRGQQSEMPRTVISGQRAAVTEELRAAAMADPLRRRVPGETEELRAEDRTELRIPGRAVI